MKHLSILAIFSFMFLQGCGTDQAIKTSAYGADAYKAKCKNTPESCLEQAYAKCGNRFTTLYSDSHAGGILADLIPNDTAWYVLTFRCGGPGTPPKFPWVGPTIAEATQSMNSGFEALLLMNQMQRVNSPAPASISGKRTNFYDTNGQYLGHEQNYGNSTRGNIYGADGSYKGYTQSY